MDTEQRHELTPYVVVLKADSNARFRRSDESMAFRIPVNSAPGFIKFSTRFTDEGHEAATPRELIVECMGFAPTLDGAIANGRYGQGWGTRGRRARDTSVLSC